jgi:membrane protease YdiL (CAAX protease family)
MKKNGFKKWPKFKIKQVNISSISTRTLLLNVYFTQMITLIIALLLYWIQNRNPLREFDFPIPFNAWIWGCGFVIVVMVIDVMITRWVPEDVTDDGGINDKIFQSLPLIHIAILSFVVAVCEELLFRGTLQYWIGAYWTSIVFALLHFRYLKHWLMTGLVFSISYGLGWIMIHTGTLWTPIIAHFLLDFIMGIIIRFRRSGTT